MSVTTGPYNLGATFLRLRPDVSVEPLPGGAAFWQQLASGKLGDFHNEYLVTVHSFDTKWPMWEMHPKGDEVVCLLSGAVDFTLEQARGNQVIALRDAGAYVIVPTGTWHTAKPHGPSQMLFITAGEGTQHRPVAG